MITELLVFVFLASAAVTTAVAMILQRNPVNSAVSLIGNFFCLAGLYLLLRAQMLAVLEIAVYAGAIMVLFVFVIMLLNAGAERKAGRSVVALYVGAPFLVVFLGLVSFLILALVPSSMSVRFGAFTGGSARNIGRILFTNYLLPFEVTSVLILVAILGAVVLARKELD